MKKKTVIIAGVAATLLIGTTAAMAFGPGKHRGGMGMMHRGMKMFNRADVNKDGVVTREEATQARNNRFAKFDADGDGKVTQAEIDKGLEKRLMRIKARMRYRMLSRFDFDGDGVISADEFKNRPMRMFNMADLNGDGQVTRQEVMQMRSMMGRHRKGGWGRHRGHHMGGRGMHMMRRGWGPGYGGGQGPDYGPGPQGPAE